MQISQLPGKFVIPFADSAGAGFIRPIPQASQIGINPGAASLTDGFPPLTFLPVGGGGIPPDGRDFNGIFNEITLWQQWQGAGGLVQYDSAFATAVGGYPLGAIVAGLASGVLWLCTADNNTSNPDTGGANWLQVSTSTVISSVARTQIFKTSGTFTVPAGVTQIQVELQAAGGGAGASGDGSAGGVAGNVGCGGGGGAWAFKTITGLTPGQTIAVTIGAAGVSAASGTSSSAAASAFGAFLTCNGGSAGSWGANTTAAGGAGGTSSGSPDLSVNGTAGGFSGGNSTGSVTQSQVISNYWRGGNAVRGVVAMSGTGNVGLGYGPGGNGASGGNNLVGGNGAAGLCIVRW